MGIASRRMRSEVYFSLHAFARAVAPSTSKWKDVLGDTQGIVTENTLLLGVSHLHVFYYILSVGLHIAHRSILINYLYNCQ